MDGDRYALQVRPQAPLVSARQERFRQRLAGSRARLRDAVERVREAGRELTPAARIGEQPVAWIVRALLVGLAVGLLTARRRRI